MGENPSGQGLVVGNELVVTHGKFLSVLGPCFTHEGSFGCIDLKISMLWVPIKVTDTQSEVWVLSILELGYGSIVWVA